MEAHNIESSSASSSSSSNGEEDDVRMIAEEQPNNNNNDDIEAEAEDNDDDDDTDDAIEDESIVSGSYFSGGESSDSSYYSEDEDGGTVVVHYGVSCDECGVSPIRGIRYHSRRIIDYDICQDCYERNHKNWTMEDAFMTLHRNTNVDETAIFGGSNNGNDPDSLRIDALGWTNLVETLCIHENHLQNLDLNLDAYEEYSRYHFSEENYHKVSRIIGNSKVLKCFYIEFPRGEQTEYHNRVFDSIFQGIKENKSIITLSITLDFGVYETSIINTICNLIRTHKYIRHLFVRHRKKRLQARGEVEELMRIINEAVVEGNPESRATMLARIQRNNMEQHHDHVRLATTSLFEALSETSLYSFACKVPDFQLGNECRMAAANALNTRPYLKTVKGEFVELHQDDDNNENDGENNNNNNNNNNDFFDLDRLMKEKQNYWTMNWNDLDATYSSIIQILDDIRIRVDERDQVAALFHLIRNNPGSLPKQH